MGAYCLLGSIPAHRASVGEILEVLWFDYHGAIIFGDRKEIACIPHAGVSAGDHGDTSKPAPQGRPALARTGHPIHALVLPRRSVRAARWPQSEPLAPCGVQTAARVELAPSAARRRRRPKAAG